MPEQAVDDIVKQYGGQISVEDAVAKYGGTISGSGLSMPPVTGKQLSASERKSFKEQIARGKTPESVAPYVRPLPKGTEDQEWGLNPLRAAQGVAETAWGAAKGIVGTAKDIAAGAMDYAATGDPRRLGETVVAPSMDQLEKARAMAAKGRISEAAGHAIGAIPFVGPAAVNAAETMLGKPEMPPSQSIENYDPNSPADVQPPQAMRGIGQMLALGALSAPKATAATAKLAGVPKVAGKIAAQVGPIIPNKLNPVEEAAMQYIEKDVPVSVGQRTGNRGLQRIEQGLENFPGSSNRAHEFFRAQQESLGKKADALAAQASPVKTDAVGAGQAVQQKAVQRIVNLRNQADQLYNEVRASAEKAKTSVQVGTRQAPVLGPSGQPVQAPIMQTFEAPVDLGPYRTALAPIYRDLMEAMPVARREASPAFRALQNLMEGDQPYMDAMAFDKTLGAIKALARDGQNPYLSNHSQGIAKQMVKMGERQLDQALSSADPALPAKLRSARSLVKSYHDTAELMSDLNNAAQEPAALYSRIVGGGDRVHNQLAELQKFAPDQIKIVGRTFLETLMRKATAEGGFGRADGVMRDWQRLGPRAKESMYGEPLAQDLDNFFLAAKRLTRPANPSGSAHMVAALHGLGAAGTAIGAALTGNIPVAAGAIGEAFVVPNIAARMLLTPGGARLLTRKISGTGGTSSPSLLPPPVVPPAPNVQPPAAAVSGAQPMTATPRGPTPPPGSVWDTPKYGGAGTTTPPPVTPPRSPLPIEDAMRKGMGQIGSRGGVDPSGHPLPQEFGTLRGATGIPKEQFDAEILRMADEGKIYLTRADHPYPGIENSAVRDPQTGVWYVAATFR